MDYKLAINEILERSEKLAVPIRDLCREAGISVSTFYRWRQEDANPRMRDMMRALEKMKSILDERESELRAYLDRGAAE